MTLFYIKNKYIEKHKSILMTIKEQENFWKNDQYVFTTTQASVIICNDKYHYILWCSQKLNTFAILQFQTNKYIKEQAVNFLYQYS